MVFLHYLIIIIINFILHFFDVYTFLKLVSFIILNYLKLFNGVLTNEKNIMYLFYCNSV